MPTCWIWSRHASSCRRTYSSCSFTIACISSCSALGESTSMSTTPSDDIPAATSCSAMAIACRISPYASGASAAEKDLFGACAGHADGDLVQQLLLRVKIWIVLGSLPHVTEGLSSRCDRDRRDRSWPHQFADEGVARLVMGDPLPLFAAGFAVQALAHHHLFDGLFEVFEADLVRFRLAWRGSPPRSPRFRSGRRRSRTSPGPDPSKSTSAARGRLRVWIFRMCSRPSRSGMIDLHGPVKTPRPQESAGPSRSGRLVAAMTKTRTPLFVAHHAVHLHEQLVERLIVLHVARVLSPLPPSTSISSIKMTAHDLPSFSAAALACLKRRRTRCAPTPAYTSTNSEPLAEKTQHPRSWPPLWPRAFSGAGRSGKQDAF